MSPDRLDPVTPSDPYAEWALPIPNAPALLGVSFYNQALILRDGGPVPTIALSYAAAATIGQK
ncbi:MAG: hypothetical protein AAF628_34650 [Planctomycetota bacterium]